MLRKIYKWVVPDSVKQKILERNPYYQRFLDLSKRFDELEAILQEQKLQLCMKDTELARLTDELQEQCVSAEERLKAKETEIKNWAADCRALQEQLKTKEAMLVRLTDELQEQRVTAEGQLKAKEAEISRITDDLQTHQVSAEDQLKAKEAEIARLTDELQNQRETVENQLKAKEAELTSRTADYQALQEQLHSKDDELGRWSADCRALQEQLRLKDDELGRWSADCQALQEQLRLKDDELGRWSTDCQTLQEQLRLKDDELGRWSADCQALQEQLRLKDDELGRWTADCRALQEQLRAKDEELTRLTAECQEKTQADFRTYQFSLQQIFQNPSIRKDHLCSICGNLMHYSFSRRIMNKYDVSYFYCEHCDHLQTEKPYWLAEAYESPLSDSDTGQIWRNEWNCDLVCAALQFFCPPSDNTKILEYAGGYGLLTRMLRDAGAECFWYDKYAENIFARHFEDDGEQQYDLVLAFEALEHFEDPMKELECIFKRSDALLFSEVLLSESCPAQWWYLCTEHGQHINFYSLKTFQYIAEHFHKKLYFHDDIGLMTSREIKHEEFIQVLAHSGDYAGTFREKHSSLREKDMDCIIKKMRLS